MIALVAAIAAICLLGGILLACWRPAPRPPGTPPRGTARRRAARLSRLSPRSRALVLFGIAVGVIVWILTGWAIAVIALPVGLVGLPLLLVAGDEQAVIDRLEAMQDWVRSLAGVLTAGTGIEEALLATWKSAPAPISAEVQLLASRLRARWQTPDALRAFGDDLADATGDLIVYTLLIGVKEKGSGLSQVLDNLAKAVANDVRLRREIESERAKTRSTARWITVISLACMLGTLLFRQSYVASYRTGLGQALLLVLLAAYAGCLAWVRRSARGKPVPRFLRPSAPPESSDSQTSAPQLESTP